MVSIHDATKGLPMRTRRLRRLAVALAGLTATGALFVGGVAVGHAETGAAPSSDTTSDVVDAALDTGTDTDTAAKPRCTAVQRWTALAEEAPQVRDLLSAHPDVAAELDHARTLPRGQRRAEIRDWVTAHPDQRDTVTQLRDLRAHARGSCTSG